MIKCVMTGKSFFHLDFNRIATRTALLFISITYYFIILSIQYYRDNLLYKFARNIMFGRLENYYYYNRASCDI